MTTPLAKDARRAIINRCASHLSARFAGRAFAVAPFANFNTPPADSSPSCADGQGPTLGTVAGVGPTVSLNLHEVPCA